MEAAKYKNREIIEVVDINFPHLVNLNEDSQLSHKLRYSLKKLPISVGKTQGISNPDIVLSGTGIKNNHATFTRNTEIKNEIVLKANDPDAQDFIFINGKKLLSSNGQELKHKDRIAFGTNVFFIFMWKSDNRDIYEIDWDYAQKELQTEIDLYRKEIDEEKEQKYKNEFDIFKKNLEDKYKRDKKELEEKVKYVILEYDRKIKDLINELGKFKVEADIKHIQNYYTSTINSILEDNSIVEHNYQNYQINTMESINNNFEDTNNNSSYSHSVYDTGVYLVVALLDIIWYFI